MKTEVASSAEVEDSNQENERTSIQPSPLVVHQTVFSTASMANSDLVVSSSTANNNSVDDDADHDSLFGGDFDTIEDVASNPAPLVVDDAKEETLDEMAAQMEADLEAGL